MPVPASRPPETIVVTLGGVGGVLPWDYLYPGELVLEANRFQGRGFGLVISSSTEGCASPAKGTRVVQKKDLQDKGFGVDGRRNFF